MSKSENDCEAPKLGDILASGSQLRSALPANSPVRRTLNPDPVGRLVRLAHAAGLNPLEVLNEYRQEGPLARLLGELLGLPQKLDVDLGPIGPRRGAPLKGGPGKKRKHFYLVEGLLAAGLDGEALRQEIKNREPGVQPASILRDHRYVRGLKTSSNLDARELIALFAGPT